MKIIFSSHAKVRMRQRNIGKSVVLETIQNPDDVELDGLRGECFIKKFGEKTLKVPFAKKQNDIIVKSVFYKNESNI